MDNVKDAFGIGCLRQKFCVFILLISLSVLILGCATPTYRFYEGPPRLPGEVAFLTGDENGQIVLYKVDGQPPAERDDYGAKFLIELLPGKHSITVRWWGYPLVSKEDTVLEFEAEAGQTYAVMGPLDKRKPKGIGFITIHPQNMWIDNKRD